MDVPVTELLAQWKSGVPGAEDRLFGILTHELRDLAGAYLRRERDGHTLQPTALVNEAWVRLTQQETPDFESRAHFFGIAARLMRQILVDHARARQADRRDGGVRVTLSDAEVGGDPDRLIELHQALEKLAAFDERRARVLELRYFGGLSRDEIAAVLGVTERVIKRDLVVAHGWLRHELAGEPTLEP